MNDLKLGLALGYWSSTPPANFLEQAILADELGYDSVWTAETYGNDAFTPLSWIGANTKRIKLGTCVAQLSARTPTAAAMAALSIDHLSKGRMILGLGVSGPQVVEGWYGQPFKKPLARTREYIDIIRQVMRREQPVQSNGEHYPLPYRGDDASGMGKALKPIVHPLRSELPIYLGAEGPKNIALSTEIAEGWLPLLYSPFREEVYADALKGARDDFQIAQLAIVTITDDVPTALLRVKNMIGFYVGGMGSKTHNFHKELMVRMGYEAEANKIQELFFAGKREEAIMTVPDEFADEVSLTGSRDKIRDRLQAWQESRVTSILFAGDIQAMRTMAELML